MERWPVVLKVILPISITLLLSLIAASVSYGSLQANVFDLDNRMTNVEKQADQSTIDMGVHNQELKDLHQDITEMKSDIKTLLGRK